MEGDLDRMHRLGEIINKRKQALVEGDRAKNMGLSPDSDADPAGADLRDTLGPMLAYHDLEISDVDWVIGWIVKHGIQALQQRFPAVGVITGTWLDGLQTGLLLAQLRAEDGAKTNEED